MRRNFEIHAQIEALRNTPNGSDPNAHGPGQVAIANKQLSTKVLIKRPANRTQIRLIDRESGLLVKRFKSCGRVELYAVGSSPIAIGNQSQVSADANLPVLLKARAVLTRA